MVWTDDVARVMLATTVIEAGRFYFRFGIVELLVLEDPNAMNAILFLSGKEPYLHEPGDDVFGGDCLYRLERTEAVELLLTGKPQRRDPRPEGRRPLGSCGDA